MAGAKGSKTALSQLELAIETLVEYYNNCSSKKIPWLRKEGIGERNFKEMVQKDLNHMLTDTENKEEVKKLMKKLDQNGDGVIDFKEYWELIGAIAMPISRNMQS